MSLNLALENLRQDYQGQSFDIKDCDKNPFKQFDHWLQNALEAECDEPNAFVFSTVKNNMPKARVVLLKGIHQDKFVFYTNRKSAKGEEISTNDHVAMTFLWLPLQRQVRIEGTISLASDELSDEYFQKRPRGSQLGAIASPQSQIMKSREELEALFLEVETKFKDIKILPRPKHWGGYAISPTYIEFWQGRNNRMHDRICFKKNAQGWDVYRLAP